MKDTLLKHKKSLVFLTGFMGSGKSTIGPILANTLGFQYIDLDRIIEQKAQKKVVEIFSTDGEQYFRTLERTALEELAEFDHHVISLGGGTLANEENFQLVSQNGILVYLKLSPEEILQRVQLRSDRPMLKDDQGNKLAPAELEKRVFELMNRREPFYNRADVIIMANRMRLGATVDEIMKSIRTLIGKD
jgi:shikimate kinase